MSWRAGSRRAASRRLVQVGSIVAFMGLVPIGPAHSTAPSVRSGHTSSPGLSTLTGLVPGLPGSACRGLFEVVGVSPRRCSHGPDPSQAAKTNSATTSSDPLVGSAGQVLCYGDGQDGSRIEVIYAVPPGTRDRFASELGSIRNLAGNVDNVMAVSAAKTGGERHYRFVTNNDCSLVVHDVSLSLNGDRSFAATINDLITLGFNRNDRQYLVLVDSSVYCGIATVNGDDAPYSDNSSNRGPGYARIDRHCWTTGAAAHEMMHMLGAVQLSAPNSTGHYHCTDTPDAMCYADAADVHTVQRCSSNAGSLYDCNNDDYFNTFPPAGSYLDTHWNTADNQFLETRAGSSTFPGPPIAPPANRHRTVVQEFSGSLSPTHHMAIIELDVYDGPIALHLENTGVGSVAERLEDESGVELASWSGPSPQDHDRLSSRGAYRIVITGNGPLNYQGTITYIAP